MKLNRFRFAIIRHIIAFLIIFSLCYVYHKNTGRWQIWFFMPVSLLPLLITILHYRSVGKNGSEDDEKLSNELHIKK